MILCRINFEAISLRRAEIWTKGETWEMIVAGLVQEDELSVSRHEVTRHQVSTFLNNVDGFVLDKKIKTPSRMNA